MRRWIAIALLALLPMQWTWALAAAYCADETAPAAAHFGHHDAQGHAGSATPPEPMADGGTADTDTTVGGHADCASCHLGALQTAMAHAPVFAVALPSEHATRYARHLPEPEPGFHFRPPLTATA
jgi:hypothetical protein